MRLFPFFFFSSGDGWMEGEWIELDCLREGQSSRVHWSCIASYDMGFVYWVAQPIEGRVGGMLVR